LLAVAPKRNREAREEREAKREEMAEEFLPQMNADKHR